MRRIQIENARKRKTAIHGWEVAQFEISEGDAIVGSDNLDELLDLDAALNKLAVEEPELVKLRLFAGLTLDDTANALNVSPRTVTRNWAFVRAWLSRELKSKTKN